MKRTLSIYITTFFLLIVTGGSNCSKKNDNPINYESGIFPEEVFNLEGLNSSFDDYNAALPQIVGELPLMFSSNRNSQGSHFDIVTGFIFFAFSQYDAGFCIEGTMFNNTFYNSLEQKVNTERNELGPYRLFNGENGFEYFFYAEENTMGDLDLKYLTYSPADPYNSLLMAEPAAITALNSSSNDAYICIDNDLTTAYFTNDSGGDFDIMEAMIVDASSLNSWLEGDPVAISVVDSINSEFNDKCPFLRNDIMIFTSDRPGGMGGYDLYYSVYREGKWSTPNNMGPGINTEYNEYRPLIGSCPDYSNHFLLFSSDRPSGLGGYDLYFTGIDLEILTE